MIDAAPTVITYLFDEVVVDGDKTMGLWAGDCELTRDWYLAVWQHWNILADMLTAQHLTSKQREQFPFEVTRMAVLVTSFFDEFTVTALYVHTLVMHMRRVVELHGSIGKFMQQGVERVHQKGKDAFKRVAGGGQHGQITNEQSQEWHQAGRTNMQAHKLHDAAVKPETSTTALIQSVSNYPEYAVFSHLMLCNHLETAYYCSSCDTYKECKHTPTAGISSFSPSIVKQSFQDLKGEKRRSKKISTRVSRLLQRSEEWSAKHQLPILSTITDKELAAGVIWCDEGASQSDFVDTDGAVAINMDANGNEEDSDADLDVPLSHLPCQRKIEL